MVVLSLLSEREKKMKVLSPDRLQLMRGNNQIDATEFCKLMKRYFSQLQEVGRDNYLFYADMGPGNNPYVTGYRTKTTVNVTLNSKIIECEKFGGRWALFELLDTEPQASVTP